MLSLVTTTAFLVGLVVLAVLYVAHLERLLDKARSTIAYQRDTIWIYHQCQVELDPPRLSGARRPDAHVEDVTATLAKAGRTYCIQHDISETEGGKSYV